MTHSHSGYAAIREGGPYFDDLSIGQLFDWAPAVTLSSGLAAAHQSIVGDRLRMACDANLSAVVTGEPAALAHPGLVCDVAIGQSTLVTQRVKANLFYRGLRFHRFPVIGDTLYTRTTVVGLRANKAKSGRAPTGLAALRMTTVDQADRLVLDFHRCAMLPASPDWRHEDAEPGDDLATIGADAATPAADPTGHWDAAAFRKRVPGPHFADLGASLAGAVLHSTADLVSSAPELARLTLNIAATHHDWRVGGQRLVYGGHTIGLALGQASRLLPNLVTVVGWESCDHTGPVHESDTLYSELHVESAETTGNGGLLGLRSVVYAVSDAGDGSDRQVLDWRFSAVHF
ncbi:MaoC family dehydratase [Mycobacterium spongiae]|uniref:Acyl dehydratase n=1 Tax=Mycobacterium spongiae TaxID=886343 RepID=A0A975PVU1_9MYCO|nr:MaoC family dehydratase [Mycobacterium spongiae]QUR65968.1 acyl dehydratase [Mycobacterium spongiae]